MNRIKQFQTKRMLQVLPILVLLLFTIHNTFGQDRFKKMEKELSDLAVTVPSLTQPVNISVSNVSIQEFLRGVANNVNLNITVDPGIKATIVNNFSSVKVIDMLLFICKEYNLDIKTYGSIISIQNFAEPPAVAKTYVSKILNIKYDKSTDLLSIDLANDSLPKVVRAIIDKSEKNIILSPGLGDMLVSSYIQSMPFDKVIEQFAWANNLSVSKNEDNFYVIEKLDKVETASNNSSGIKTKNTKGTTPASKASQDASLDLQVTNSDSIKIDAVKYPIIEIITGTALKLKKDYHLVSDIEGETTMIIDAISFDDLLNRLFEGTKYSYRIQDNIYLLGESKEQELHEYQVLHLQYRSVEKLVEVIPADLKKDLDVKEFLDLNSLLVSGPVERINNLKSFIRQIDKVVPVVLIEVIIVDYNSVNNTSSGIRAGLSDEPVTTGGSIFPGLDMTLSSGAINGIVDLINSFDGFGAINLGKVTPNFYISLTALEENGILKLRSTPKLSTLNGHEATLSIGKTEYYLEEQNNIIGTQNPQSVTTRKYQSVNADLSLTITPVVSGDEQVTLNIKVQQSDFTARMSKDAPPGKVSRNFESLIRIKNQEVVILGGLEDKSTSDTGSGVPLLSRIPVIKWFFSYRAHEKKKSKLNIFIKPTVIY